MKRQELYHQAVKEYMQENEQDKCVKQIERAPKEVLFDLTDVQGCTLLLKACYFRLDHVARALVDRTTNYNARLSTSDSTLLHFIPYVRNVRILILCRWNYRLRNEF